MSKLLDLTTELNRPTILPSTQAQMVYAMTALVPTEALAKRRIPLNLSLLLDCSPSMEGEKLINLKAVAHQIIDKLEPDDSISLIRFAEGTQVLVPSAKVTEKRILYQAIDGLYVGTDTFISHALHEGLKEVARFDRPDRASRIVLLTDGDPTDSEDDCRAAADQAGNQGIPILILGFGTDWKEDLLVDLADRSVSAEPGSCSGYVGFIEKPEQALEIFDQIFQSLQVVAKNVTVKLSVLNGAEIRKVWQILPGTREFGRSIIRGQLVDIPVGDLEKLGVAFILALKLNPHAETGYEPVLHAEMECSIPGVGSQKLASDLGLIYSTDPAQIEVLNEQVIRALERMQALLLQNLALEDVESRKLSDALVKLRQASVILQRIGSKDWADQLEREAQHLEQNGQLSAEGVKTLTLSRRQGGTRKFD